ncbi:hypothetical protein SAMN05444374_109178 [Rhodococcoides kroppenstedtii]|uniref:Uncharacterized protein n=1 Tax=Rhodococcoides kroppenstedtii TaxID=293050 RepID=A0A1I0TTZ0_9NOCA|nr:hypothetical protein SAMN05444374_109178 [Rhodococcus kroppenstedtii]
MADLAYLVVAAGGFGVCVALVRALATSSTTGTGR